ncbi:unnamed protein product [Trypanosoma congolense IL3000]|uniref:WGS project CAEQ00000000 data, annotated contig 1644 n=1 Tax=Trypanosoma congolense (strain IL3000) TaxID=1068625 RepID=F9W7R2_TRYCI|nr:unnamed protein product [Trypanosoma congolense IL3000]
MLAVSRFVCCEHTYQRVVDRVHVSRCHHQLISSRYWECSTPSKALATLSVLVRSRTFIDRLDKAATGALDAMVPSMTRNERALLRKLSAFLGLRCATVCERPPLVPNPNVVVITLYSAFMGEGPLTLTELNLNDSFSSDCVSQLNVTCTLMLFEMMTSSTFLPGASWRSDDGLNSLLARLRHDVMHDGAIDFRTLKWIIERLNGTSGVLGRQQVECARLLKACVKRLNDILPHLSMSECLLILPLLDSPLYERPFIVCSDIVRRLAVCDELEMYGVETSTLLGVLACGSLDWTVLLKICRALQRDLRVGDLSKRESLFLLSALTARLSACDAARSVREGDIEEKFCEELFVQLYVNVKHMTAAECVEVLGGLEVMYVSSVISAPPSDLVEKLRKKAFFNFQQDITRGHTKAEQVEHALESLQRLEELLKRCLLLPILERDMRTIMDLRAGLVRELKRIG